jgi:hypothetical protein
VSYLKEKWQANIDKVSFAKAFPGRLHDWEGALGKTLEAVISIPTAEEPVTLVFTDGDFIISPKLTDTPKDILLALKEARPLLERFHAEAYQTLEKLTERDREMTSKARMQRIIDAVRNNVDTMPDLKEALLEVLADHSGE